MSSQLINMISASFVETIIMVLISGGIGAAIGIPLGILLFITDRKSFLPMPKIHFVLSIIINATRSVPFIILLVAIIPFTRLWSALQSVLRLPSFHSRSLWLLSLPALLKQACVKSTRDW